jgi:hypothetical protein
MRERRTKEEEPKKEVTSDDIQNAHAAGDGAMGRNDEKVSYENEDEEKQEGDQGRRTEY